MNAAARGGAPPRRINYRFFGMRKRWSDLSLLEFTMNAAAPGGAPPRRINYRDFQMKG